MGKIYRDRGLLIMATCKCYKHIDINILINKHKWKKNLMGGFEPKMLLELFFLAP